MNTEANTVALAKIDTNPATVRDSILSVLERADTDAIETGVEWYPSARLVCSDLATRYGLSLETVGGIVAALSPRTPWDRNIAGATACARGSLTGGFLSRSVDAANAIRSGAPIESVLKGPKTRAFARNVIGDYAPVTIDVWARRVALPDHPDTVLGRVGVYAAVADAYREAAAVAGFEAPEVQAITWITVRGKAH